MVTKGFTLIEIIVVFGILALIGGLTSDLFASVLKGANKANTINEIKQNGNYALDYIERVVRNSASVVSNPEDTDTLVVSDKETGACVKFKVVNNVTGQTNGRIDVYNALSCVYTNGLFDDESTFALSSGKTLTNSNEVTGVSLVDGSFEISAVSGNPTTVTISFTLSQGEKANSRNDYTASEFFQSFISLRTY